MFQHCPLLTEENINQLLFFASEETPVIIPLPIARLKLGWEDFFVPTKYVEPA
jgi:hypothetical protein